MSVNYPAIFKQAFETTFRYPVLWLLGLFLAGGFNANFFYLANLRWGWRDLGWQLFFRLDQATPTGHLLLGVIVVILFAAMLVVITNWAKIVFILYASDVLKLPRIKSSTASSKEPAPLKQLVINEAPRYLPSVIAMSLFTVISLSVLTTILAGGSQWFFASRGLVWSLAAVLLVIFIFLFSCLNIFGTFFIVFYRRSFSSALNLAFDLIITHWKTILVMAFWLMVIYGLCFFAGRSILSVVIYTPVAGLVLWFWLAVVNTFFNLSLMLLFSQLVKPPTDPEAEQVTEKAPLPAPTVS